MRSRRVRPVHVALVDASAFFGVADQGDANHAAAMVVQRRLATERWRLVTTNFMVAEAHALVLARRHRDSAMRLLREIDQGRIAVIRAEESDEQRAREIVYRYTDKDFSLTDAISFAVMERLGIGHAFTFDRHFAQYGFVVLGPQHS